ncbi:MAG: PA domain-containing protein, partial [Anaerovorax sp.]
DLKQSLKTEVIIGGETYYGNYYGPVIGSLANVAVSEITGMPGDGNNFSAKIPVIGKDALVQMAGGTTPSAINTKVVELAGSLKEKGAQGLIIYNNVKTQEGNWVSMSLKGLDALAPAIPVFALDGATGKLLLEQKGSELLAPYTQKKS